MAEGWKEANQKELHGFHIMSNDKNINKEQFFYIVNKLYYWSEACQ